MEQEKREKHDKDSNVNPKVDVSLCHRCNRMTDVWNTDLEQWLCVECLKIECVESHHALEDILERMCN